MSIDNAIPKLPLYAIMDGRIVDQRAYDRVKASIAKMPEPDLKWDSELPGISNRIINSFKVARYYSG